MLDTHAHLDFPEFDADRDAVFLRMREAGIDNLIIPGVSPAHWHKQLALAQQYHAYYALGIHPWFCPEDLNLGMSALTALVNEHLLCPQLVAVGECGLDKRYRASWPQQLALFEAQLELAQAVDLPVIVHCVQAHGAVLACLKTYSLAKGGVIHGFSGGPELAWSYIQRGFKLGIGGLIMDPHAKKLHQTVSEIPLEHLLLETDSPGMTPKNVSEKRNEPANAAFFVQQIAHLQKKSCVLISEQLQLNASQLFEL
ncbi:MAG: TatD family hydrolase [Shewanella sp.]